jgi:filamentous hemagglutinin family protein
MTSHLGTGPRPSHLTPLLTLSGLLWLWALLAVSQAAVTSAITSDGTLGTTVTRSGTIHTITGGTRPDNGRNLFHSFDRFSVGTGDTALFSGSGQTGIVNILSRVTGGQPSEIHGRLQSTIPGANLFLLNPSGVMFGPNASLAVSGSFHTSTADYLRFEDGARFYTSLGQASVLTVAPPTAFGFLGNPPAPVTIQGSRLAVGTGRALSVIGGDIAIVDGSLSAPSGRLQVASVAAPGDVRFNALALAPDLQVEGFARLGQIQLQGAAFSVSGLGGGIVRIWGGHLKADRVSMLANTFGPVPGVSLAVDLQITGRIDLHDSDIGAIVTGTTSASASGGNIRVQAETLTLTGGSRIITSTTGPGRGGNITVAATAVISLADESSISASSAGVGEVGGGVITLSAGHLILLRDSELRARVQGGGGDAGNLLLEAPFVIVDHSDVIADAFGGRGGNITSTGEVFLRDPASLVDASSALNAPGTIDIQAPVTSLSGIVAPLPQAFVSAAVLLPARCAARLRGGTYSSLVLGGRDGLPAEPSSVLPSPLALDERLVADLAVTGARPQPPSTGRSALLTGPEKSFPRLRGTPAHGTSPGGLAQECP